MSLDTLIATGEFASILPACIIWPEIGPKREGMNWKGWKSVCSIYGDFGLPVLTHTQVLKELPAAPSVFGARPQRRCDQCLSPRWVEGGQHTDSRTHRKQFLASKPSTEIFSERGANGGRRHEAQHRSPLVPAAAQGILVAQGRARHSSLSQAAGAGSGLSACTDYPINLNLILFYPTYTMRLISHLNASIVNVTLRHVLDPFVACGEERALLRCD